MSGDDLFDPSSLCALVLDPNHFERSISLEQLRVLGFGRAIGAADTAEAWQALHANNPNIVLIEWMGEAEEGLGFVRRVRTSEDLPNRAVSMFMLTTRSAQADVEMARQAGIDGYLRKPISARALHQRVRTVIAHPQPFVVTTSYVGPCRRRRRPDLNYLGPLRRLDDAATAFLVEGDEDELHLKAELARARVTALEECAKRLAPGDARAAREVYMAVRDLQEVGEQIGDPSLVLGAKEMARYLQAEGATEWLSPDVVRTHVAALHQLAHLPHALSKERQRVAAGLKRMVDKKLKQAASAA